MRRFFTAFFFSFLFQSFLLRAQNQFGPANIVVDAFPSANEDGGSSLVVADFDGDGHKDFIAGQGGVRELMQGRNDGLGNFAVDPVLIQFWESGPSDLKTADFDSDGDYDLFYVTYGGAYYPYLNDAYSIGVLLNDGAGNFTENVSMNLGLYRSANIEVQDLDNDGDYDILTVKAINNNSSLVYFLNDGQGGFENEIVIVETFEDYSPLEYNSPRLSDLDSDGDLDIVYLALEGTYFCRNEGNGAFSESTPLISYTFPINLEVFDIDNDGDFDIITSFYSSGLVDNLLFRNTESGSFSNPEVLFSSPNLVNVANHDLNGDGFRDMAFVFYTPYSYDIFTGLFNAMSDGNGGFLEVEEIDDLILYPNGRVEFADVDSDGDSDIIASSFDIVVWYENMPGLPAVDFEYLDCQEPKIIINSSVAFVPNSVINWDFGNGLSSSEFTPDIPYTELGTYDLSLSICNIAGCNTLTQTVEVSHLANYTIPSFGLINEEVVFSDASSGYTNWSWIFGDGATSIQQNATHTYSEAGTYLVEFFLTDALEADCTTRITQEIVIEEATGVENEKQSEIKISPNPTTDYCLIEVPSADNWKYQLYDVSGSLLVEGSFEDKTFQLDTSVFLNGVYLLHLVNANENSIKHKLTVLKD